MIHKFEDCNMGVCLGCIFAKYCYPDFDLINLYPVLCDAERSEVSLTQGLPRTII